MKRYLTIVLLALCAVGGMSAQDPFESVLCWFDDGTSSYRPVSDNELILFYQPVTVLDGAEVTIESDGEVMLRAKGITVCADGILVDFERTMLPKGRTYTVVIREGSLALAGNPEVISPRLEFEYTIRETIGIPSLCYITQWDGYKRITDVSWWIDDMCQVAGDGRMQIYSDGTLMGEYEMSPRMSDWNMYYVEVHFSSPLILKKGVRYTLVIPEGSLVSVYRDDIFNERGECEIYGWGQAGAETPVTAAGAGDEPLCDMSGRPVVSPVPGTICIGRKGKFVAR